MPGHTRLELPPALETRPANKNRVVGAPDMPRPRKSPAEVMQEKAQKRDAKTRAAKKEEEARQRVQDLQASLSENGPTQTETPPAHQPLKIVIPPSRHHGRAGNQCESQPIPAGKECTLHSSIFSMTTRSNFSPATAGHNNTAENDSEEDGDPLFEPMDEDEDSSRDDEGDIQEQSGKNKKRAPASRARKTTQAVGKRKQDDMGEPECVATKATGGPVTKRPRQNHSSQAPATGLVPNWMDIINRQPPSRGRSATPAASVSIPSSVSTSRSPSRPPSSISGGDTSENEESQEPLNILEGAGPGSTIANVSDALRYRAKTYHPAFAAPDEYVNSGTNVSNTSSTSRDAASKASHEARSASRLPTNGTAITHPLTKIVTPSRIPGEPGPDTSSTSTKKSRKRTGKGGGSESVPGAGNTDSSESKSVTLRLIPQSMQALFTERFVPLTRQFAGTLDPWQEVTLNELKTLYLQAFGNLAQVHPLQEGDKCHKLIQQKLNDWRAKFATTGGETFKEIIASDPNLVEWFTDPDNVGAYATYLLGDGKGAAPFYYAEWNEGVQKIGRMRSALIVGIFAHHISELHAINSKERTGDIPRGALCMAVLAAIHTLTHYQTGQWAPPSGRAGWFSADNYSDRMYWDANRQRERSDKKVTNILKVIDDLSGDEWFDIIEEARKVLITRRATSGRRSKAGKGKSAAVLQAEEVQSEGVAASDSDSDNGLMLVNDA